jgi:hypothetical protein
MLSLALGWFVRIALALLLTVAVACGGGSSGASPDAGSANRGQTVPDAGGLVLDAGPSADAGSFSDAGPVADAGSSPDASNPPANDAGTSDAGAPVDLPPPTDAGPPTKISMVDCPQVPSLVWQRTFADGVDYRGAVDPEGNLYWVEYDAAQHASLVSADSEGRDRLRVALPGTASVNYFMIASGKVLITQGLTLEAFDTSGGAQSWSLDLATAFPGSSELTGNFVDLGNGDLAISLDSGIHAISIANGRAGWSRPGPNQGYASDGAGSLLATGNRAGSIADYFVLDAAGEEQWRARISGAEGLTAWLSSKPWLGVELAKGISPTANFVAAPPAWFAWVSGGDLAFNVFQGTVWSDPYTVQMARGDAVVATGPIPNEISFDPLYTWPFLAGGEAKHLLLLGQSWHGRPALCSPEGPDHPWVARVKEASLSQCVLNSTVGVRAAAFLPGRVVIGGYDTVNDSCGSPPNPYVIQAFSLQGEEPASAGWVREAGSPGLGWRRQLGRRSPPLS